jgi:hypothetical protein
MSSSFLVTLLVLVLAILADVAVLRRLAKQNSNRMACPDDVQILGRYSPFLTWFRIIWTNIRSHVSISLSIEWKRTDHAIKTESQSNSIARATLEILIILIWGLFLTFPFMNMNSAVVPAGREYASHIQSHHLWTRFQKCGLCAMWNGSIQGGSPAFSDAHGSMLHPLIVITTFLAGVTNGAKLALVSAFLLAGLAQWWLSWLLGLGRVPRVWSAMMAIAGGNMAARLEVGMFGGIISASYLILVITTIILLSKKLDHRSAILLGIALALLFLSGQGYIQIGFLLISPAILFLFPSDRYQKYRFGVRLAQAGLISLLLSAPLLIPFLHFLPQFGKLTDDSFKSIQPLMYLPLNLVIRDHTFFVNESLSKLPYPSIYGNFIGWVPAILAVFTLGKGRTSLERRTTRFLFASVLLAFWFGSAQPFTWSIRHIPFPFLNDRLAGIRFPSLFAGLAVPMLISLAAIGLDILLHHRWLKPELLLGCFPLKNHHFGVDLHWILAIPIFLSLRDTYLFDKEYIQTTIQSPYIVQVNKALLTSDLQWVNSPYGEHIFMESGIGMGLKYAIGTHAWFWKYRDFPEPMVEATYGDLPPGVNDFQKVGSIKIFKWPPGREYARVFHPHGINSTVCHAYGTGGNIDVLCSTHINGTLIVKENSWSGWNVKLDGNPVPLQQSQWLSIFLPAGEHQISFRYRPWDVPLGIGFSLLGLFISIILWVKKEPPILEIITVEVKSQSPESNEEQSKS